MSYDPSTDELHRLRKELHQLRLDHISERSERQIDTIKLKGMHANSIGLLSIGAILAVLAIFWLAYAINAVSHACGCG